jgi:hypothetical protein
MSCTKARYYSLEATLSFLRSRPNLQLSTRIFKGAFYNDGFCPRISAGNGNFWP